MLELIRGVNRVLVNN